jgi:hypothetical protein
LSEYPELVALFNTPGAPMAVRLEGIDLGQLNGEDGSTAASVNETRQARTLGTIPA